MNKLRDCAIVLGLAGMLLMVAADTKDVEATGKISYEREAGVRNAVVTAGDFLAEYTDMQLYVYEWKQEQQEKREQQARELLALEEEAARALPQEEETEEAPERVIELTENDYTALLKLVEAEASGEDIKGKMLVANVVLNRVESSSFPDSVEEVVYQRAGGKAQFSPVATGKIERVHVSEETVEAVERVLSGEDDSQGALYFVSRTYASQENMRWFDQNLTFLFVYRGHEFFS